MTSDEDLGNLYERHLATMSERLSRALEATGFDGLVAFAGQLSSMPRDDVDYPFRVEPHFAAWLPVTEVPGAALVLTPGRKPRLLYPQHDDFWHAPAAEPKGYWVEHFEIEHVRSKEELARSLGRLRGRYAAIGEAQCTDIDFARDDPRLVSELAYTRALKTPYEIACMERASAVAVRGHAAAASLLGAGVSEFELHQAYCSASGQRESELPYGNIVALNEHAAILHYQRLDREAPPHCRSFLIDAGGSWAGYAADITRTYSVGDARFDALIASVDRLQRTLCAEACEGVDFVALNERAHVLLADVLVEHDLVNCAAGDAYESGLTRTFLPHGLGHLLGLQVHDAGGRQTTPGGAQRPPPEEHPFLRLTRVLEQGFAITIEPGLYFIPSLLEALPAALHRLIREDTVAALSPFGGIRVEDDLIVQSGPGINLTRAAFAELGDAR